MHPTTPHPTFMYTPLLRVLHVRHTCTLCRAVALGRLRVSGSLAKAEGSTALYESAEKVLRAELGSVVVDPAERARAERLRQRAAEQARAERLRRAEVRSPPMRWALRHLGTDAQLGAWGCVLGSALYAWYCEVVVASSPSLADRLYLASSLLWLAGSASLVHATYPEHVLRIATRAEEEAASGRWTSTVVGVDGGQR